MTTVTVWVKRLRGPAVTAALVVAMTACGSAAQPETPTTAPPPVTATVPAATVTTTTGGIDLHTATVAAETLCPVMWEWVKDVGAAFNAASKETMTLDDPASRRTRWLEALDEMEQLNTDLGTAMATMDLGPAQDLAGDVVSGLEGSGGVLDELRTLIDETPEIDEDRPQARTAQLIVRIEKVIDLPKPRLAVYDDPDLTAGFIAVPSCQHSVKDANDGTPRANG